MALQSRRAPSPLCRPFAAALLAVALLTSASISQATFPRDWFWGDDNQRAIHKSLENREFPLAAMDLRNWLNGQPGDLTGQVVVIDFWATWCGPCIASIPKLNELHAMDGVTVVGICGSGRGEERMVEVARTHNMTYPTAVDGNQAAARDWSVRWWPTYIVIDQRGRVRGVGLQTGYLESAVRALLEEGSSTSAASEAPSGQQADNATTFTPRSEWLEGNQQRRALLEPMHGRPAPPVDLTNWTNTEATRLADLRGNIVVLDFWATWCGPCIASIPRNNQIAEKYRDRGVVFLGVTHPQGGEKMEQTAREHGIRFPLALDHQGKTIENYKVDGFPDYYIIGRDGTMLAADVRNNAVEAVLEAILAEEGSTAVGTITLRD